MWHGCVGANLSISDVDPLPSEQPGINRPRAWPKQREGAGQCREHDVSPMILWPKHEHPPFQHRYNQPRNRCPQSNEEKQAPTYLEQENGG